MIVILVIYFIIIFGELVFKCIGMSVFICVVKLLVCFMYWLFVIVFFFVWIFVKSILFIFNLLYINIVEEKVIEEEIKFMIDEGIENGEV